VNKEGGELVVQFSAGAGRSVQCGWLRRPAQNDRLGTTPKTCLARPSTPSSPPSNTRLQRRVERGQDTQLQLPELMACGMIGGSFSAVTHPIDNVITNSQKPLPEGMSRGVAAVVKRIYAESGALGFTRGMGVKIVDNSYHTMWMFGVGSWVSQCVHTYLNEDE